MKWQLVQTVFSGEGLISSVKEVACFWIVVETWVVALSVSPFNNFAVTVFCVSATEMGLSYTWVAVASPLEGTGDISVGAVPSPQSIDIVSPSPAPVTCTFAVNGWPHLVKAGSRVIVISGSYWL